MAKRSRKTKKPASPPATETPEQTLERLQREHARLKREQDALLTDIAILKKAAAFMGDENE